MNDLPASKAVRDEAGQTLVLFVFALAMLCGFVAMSVDVGLILHERTDLQKTADAAALAGVQELPDSPAAAVAAAQQYAVANGIDLSDPDYTFVATTPYQGDPSQIEVTVSHDVGFTFGQVLGLNFTNVPARAVAGATPVPGGAISDASIIALNHTNCQSLVVNASATFTAEGAIMVNSECSQYAGEFGCSSICKAEGGIESVGGIKMDNNCNPCVVTTTTHFEDPLKDVLPPCFPSSPAPCQDVGALTVRNGTPDNPQLLEDSSFDFQPGIYYGGIQVGGTVTDWAPGIYVVAGGGLKINASTSFQAEGVFIYNTNDPDCPSCGNGGFGPVIIDTSSSAHMSPMTSGPYQGLLFFQDRANTETAVFNPSSSFGEGTVYFPSAFVDLNPSANAKLQIIADTVKINNSASYTAAFDGDKLFQGEGKPTVRLIE